MDRSELLSALELDRFIAFDFETTGLDVANDRPIEVAAILFEGGKVGPKDGNDFVLINNMQPGYHGVLEKVSRYHIENGKLISISPNKSNDLEVNFKLRYKNTPIFGKYFNPDSDNFESSTGVFKIKNHFFNNNEKLLYTPGSSVEGVGISSLVMTGGSPLPREVYCVLNDANNFQVSTT